MEKTPTRKDDYGAWLGCALLVAFFVIGLAAGLITMFLLTMLS